MSNDSVLSINLWKWLLVRWRIVTATVTCFLIFRMIILLMQNNAIKMMDLVLSVSGDRAFDPHLCLINSILFSDPFMIL